MIGFHDSLQILGFGRSLNWLMRPLGAFGLQTDMRRIDIQSHSTAERNEGSFYKLLLFKELDQARTIDPVFVVMEDGFEL